MTYRLKVDAGKHDRAQCPVSAVIPWQNGRAAGTVRLVRQGDRREVPCQWLAEGQNLALEWIVDGALRSETIAYTAEVSETAAAREADGGQGVALRRESDRVDILISGIAFSSYCCGGLTPKPYLGPVMGPFGESLTRLDLQTAEHPHHRSVWVGHGEVNGIDFWGEPREGRSGVHGRQVNKGIELTGSGPVYGRFSASNTWIAPSGEAVLEEESTFKVYATADTLRLLDVRVALKALHADVRFGGTKEAGPFAIRVAEGMKVDNGGSFVNGCGGIEEKECWAKRAPWCDYFGMERGHMYGIAIFDSPDNDSYPTTWHIRNYGLMSPNCFLMGERTVKAGESLSFQYRVVFHAGDVRQARIAERFSDYINPPRVTVE
jgi:hypothetical protein